MASAAAPVYFASVQPPPAWDDTPQPDDLVPLIDRFGYRIELWSPDDHLLDVLALVHTPGTAFAAYYGAIQEYPDQCIVLRKDRQVVVRSQTKERG